MIEGLTSLLGRAKVVAPEDADVSLLKDQRGSFTSHPLCIVFPTCHNDVVRLVRFCEDADLTLVPQGGNTGLVGGAVADDAGSVLVNFSKMNVIRAVYPQDRVLIAEAGCTLSQINTAAAAHGLIFPLGLSVADRCQIGGNIASNAGGINVLRHGMTRSLIYGVEGVLADGSSIHHLTRVPKNNVGFDVTQLFVGTEGTLGLITAASLKLVSVCQNSMSVMVACDTLSHVIDLFASCMKQTNDMLESFELMSQQALALVVKHRQIAPVLGLHHPWYILMQVNLPTFVTPESALNAFHFGGHPYVSAMTPDDQQTLWYPRREVPWVQGPSLKHDIAVPLSNLQSFLQATEVALSKSYPHLRPIIFGHVGDGNLHYNLLPPLEEEANPEAFLAQADTLHAIVYEHVMSFSGSISAEHGLGRVKKSWYHHYADAGTLAVGERLKKALDPHHRFNSGM